MTAVTARRLGILILPGLLVAAFCVVLLAGTYSGALDAYTLGDPGPWVRYGLPIVKVLYNLSIATCIGALALAAFVLPRTGSLRRSREQKQHGAGTPEPLWEAAMQYAASAAVVWTVAAAGTTLLMYIDIAGAQAFQAGGLSADFGFFLTGLDTGRAWLVITCIAAVAAMLCIAVRSYTGVGLTLLLAAVALVPQALTGHAAGSDNHSLAVNSIGLHLVGAVAWLGVLIPFGFLAPRIAGRADAGALLRRISALALFGFVLIASSGMINGSVRMAGPEDLLTPYGQLLLAKLVLTVVLGAIGWVHRSRIIGRVESGAGALPLFWRLLGVEALIFGAVSGLAVALSRTAPPVPQEPPEVATAARLLTGEDLPPPPSVEAVWTQWHPDVFWIAVALLASYAYIRGFLALRRRGDSWPVLRLICWLLGMAGLIYVTSGAPAVYGTVLFSGHMVQHMLLVMAVPLPMVIGAPITLLMRAVAPRRDGSRGPREWILGVVHSRFAGVLSNPIVAAVNFAGSLVVFYYSGIMWYSLDTHLGHEIMVAHFLVAGYLFAQSLIGTDPGVKRYPYPIRLLVLLITMAFHAFFGISIMSSTSLIEPNWFGNIGHGWVSAIEDQQTGGEIAWGIGELPTLLLAIGVAVQWTKSSRREAVRSDRQEDKTSDAELRAYNEMLASLSKRPQDPRR
ncbi:cytochrome c oxidase assembly protein [Sediminivirga luteola]|uniref:Copper resistance protein D domain-containing protein n=1 Tax=Sediminivirga luteola TaxID=1774748 RepID=A0A8J2U0M8_9MICO|nr:cytochrome c oxidase assembly protein [Sediminivirga luteola]GGA25810.1 hypothetical protein GCM10011333_30950 [Sediminivirga luteola]